jgi:hypothetical protein
MQYLFALSLSLYVCVCAVIYGLSPKNAVIYKDEKVLVNGPRVNIMLQ